MYLKPSEIRFSHDSIGSSFGQGTSHPFRPIGNTLDDVLSGRCNIHSIPSISVVKRNGLWFTTDNRRLWVFQEAEKRGKCSEISVRITSSTDYCTFTTKNNGVSIQIRGDPGGSLWKKMPKVKRKTKEIAQIISTEKSKLFMKTTMKMNIEISIRQEDQDTSVLLASYANNSPVNFMSPRQSYDLCGTSLDWDKNYSVDVTEREIEGLEVDSFVPFSDMTYINENNHEEPSMILFPNESGMSMPVQRPVTFSNNFYSASVTDIRGTSVDPKRVVEDLGENMPVKEYMMAKEGMVDNINIESRGQMESKILISKALNHKMESNILNIENMSRKPSNKCIFKKRIICLFTTIAFLIVIFFLIHIFLSILSSDK